MKKLILSAALGASLLAVAACGPTTRFEWGAYETALYAYTDNPEHRDTYKNALVNAIAQGAKRNAVAPGMHAELGYMLLQEGDASGAVEHFRTEASLFPESAAFMNRIIGNISASGGQP